GSGVQGAHPRGFGRQPAQLRGDRAGTGPGAHRRLEGAPGRRGDGMKKLAVAALAALIAASAAGCGRMADLDAPPAKRTERSMRGAKAESLPEPATINRPNRQ